MDRAHLNQALSRDADQSRLDRITLSMKKARLGGATKLIFSETNHADMFEKIGLEVDGRKYVVYKDYLSDVAAEAEMTDVDGFLFINNLYSTLPLACGISSETALDVQSTILAAHAAKCGVPPEGISEILSSLDSTGAYEVLVKYQKAEETLSSISQEIIKRIRARFPAAEEAEVIIFTKNSGVIHHSPGASELLTKINSQELEEVDFGKLAMEELLREDDEEGEVIMSTDEEEQ